MTVIFPFIVIILIFIVVSINILIFDDKWLLLLSVHLLLLQLKLLNDELFRKETLLNEQLLLLKRELREDLHKLLLLKFQLLLLGSQGTLLLFLVTS